ncbi:MAG: FtsX-like permease family protein [Chloroflexota bacterium]
MTALANLWFISWRNLASRKIRALLTMLGVLLGVSVVLAIQVTNQTTIDSLRKVFDRASGSASLVVIPSAEKEELLKEDLLPTVQSVKGVQIAAPVLRTRTLPADEAQNWQIALSINGVASGNFFLLYGIDPLLDPQVRVYELTEGRMPQAGRYEIVLPAKYAEDKNLRLGNFLSLLTPAGTSRLKICGLLADEGVALINDGVVGFTPIKVVQDQYGLQGKFDEIALKVPPSISDKPAQLESLKKTLQQRLGARGDVVYPEARGEVVGQMLATYQLGLSFFSVIAIFVGAYLVYNTFSMTVAERIRETGMLRAIGMSRRQILLSVLIEALILSLLGSLLGIPIGLILARGLIIMTGNVITPTHGFLSINIQILSQALAVGIGVAVVAALQPAWRAANISPLDALRVRARPDQKARPILWISGFVLIFLGYILIYGFTWPENWIFTVGSLAVLFIFSGATLTIPLVIPFLESFTRTIAARLYQNEGAIGSANIRRSISRTALTVASLMVALTMIISITSVSNSFKKDMSAWIDSALGGDLYVRSAVPMRESFSSQLKSVPGVAAVTPTRVLSVRAAPESLPANVQENEFYFNAIEPETYRKIADLQFTSNQGNSEENWARFRKGNAVFISNVMADRYQLQQGDSLILLTHRGKHAFYIAGVVLDFTGQRGVIYGTYQDLHTFFAEQGADRFTLKVQDGYSVQQVADEIEKRYQKRRHISLQTTQDFKQGILDLVERSFNLFDVLGFIGVIIGGLGVINTLTMNVIERQREIGGLRSMGMTRKQVVRMILAEAMAHGVMGGIYGLLFGYLIAQVMILGMNLMIGYDLEYRFTAQPFLIGVLIALGIAQVAAYAPARRAAGVNIINAIKHE